MRTPTAVPQPRGSMGFRLMGVPFSTKPIPPTILQVVLVAQLLPILANSGHIPWWLILFGLGSIALQWPFASALRERVARSKWVQFGSFIGGMYGVYLSFHTFLGLEAGTAFLVLCLISKLYELRARRDLYVLLTLALFVLAGLFLFDQKLLTTVLVLVGTVLVFTAFAAMNGFHPDHPPRALGRHYLLWLKQTARLLLQAVPLMVVLFLFFPRLPPLWSMQVGPGKGTTGVGDTLSPGELAELSQSTALAFRILPLQQGKFPEKSKMYWRGIVLSSFNGRSWTRSSDVRLQVPRVSTQQLPSWLTEYAQLSEPGREHYRIILEPTQQNWLFGLKLAIPESKDIQLSREFTLVANQPVTQRFSYDIQLYQAVLDQTLPDWLQTMTLRLPQQGNLKSRIFAKKLFELSGRDPLRYSQAIMRWIHQQNFGYTLKPPPLGEQRIDSFLFDTRKGYCEHYASAYTFLMRAAGVPSRVVVGYQGGTPGQDGDSWEVRQKDAHAWSEIWIAGRGWVRQDPTAAIAPERVERGMDALAEDNPELFGDGALGKLRYSQFKWLGKARAWADYAGYLWDRDVVGFDQDRQEKSLLKWFGISSSREQILWMSAGIASIIAILTALWWWRTRKRWHPVDQQIYRLSRRIRIPELQRGANEGVLHWLRRLAEYPHWKVPALEALDLYQNLRYAPVDDAQESSPASFTRSPHQREQLDRLSRLVSHWPKHPR